MANVKMIFVFVQKERPWPKEYTCEIRKLWHLPFISNIANVKVFMRANRQADKETDKQTRRDNQSIESAGVAFVKEASIRNW